MTAPRDSLFSSQGVPLLRLALQGVADRFRAEQESSFARSRRLRAEHNEERDGETTFAGDGDAHYELGSAEGMHAAMLMAERELRKVIEAL